MTPPPRSLLFVHSSDERYGADRMLLELLAALPAGTAAEVWLPTDLPHPAAPLCELLAERGCETRHVDLPVLRRAYRRPRELLRLLARAGRLARMLRSRRPDAVYCTTSATFLAAPAARLARVPAVYGHLQEIWTPGDRRMLAPLAQACRRLIAISQPVAESVGPRVRSKVEVVPNGVPEPSGGGTELERHQGPLQFVVASRWNGWKGHRTLLAAWDRIEADAVLTVLGGTPPSGDAVDVPALVRGLRRPETVRVVGEVVDPAPYLDAADVVLVPSDAPEPFGLVAIEAFARGRPVIASAGGGLLDIVTDGQDGWLFPPGDADQLARVIDGLDRAAAVLAGKLARETYRRRFTSAAFALRWRAAMGFEPAGTSPGTTAPSRRAGTARWRRTSPRRPR